MAKQGLTAGELFLDISRGFIDNATPFTLSANGTATTSFVTIAPLGTPAVVNLPAAAATLKVSSSSANDTLAGTGAQKVLVSGTDANGVALSETISMNGLTAVVTVNSYLRVNTLQVTQVGSGGVTAGVVYIGSGTVTSGVPAVINNLINTGFNVSATALFTVPVTSPWVTNLYITDITLTGTSSGTGVFSVIVRPVTGPATSPIVFKCPTTTANQYLHLNSPIVVPSGATLEVQQKGGTSLDTAILINGVIY